MTPPTYELINWYFLDRQNLVCGDVMTSHNPTIYVFGQYPVIKRGKDKVLVRDKTGETIFTLDPGHQDTYFAGKHHHK